MRYFLSASVANHERVRALEGQLTLLGHTDVRSSPDSDDVRFLGEASMTEAAYNSALAIRNSELFVSFCPLNRHTSVELGIALSSKYAKRIILWSPTGVEFTPGFETSKYYFHPTIARLQCSFSELVDYIKNL